MPLAVTGPMLYIRSYQNLEKELEQDSKVALSITQDSISNYLKEFIFINDYASKDVNIQKILSDSAAKGQVYELINRILTSEQEVMSIYVGDSTGRTTTVSSPPSDLPKGDDLRVRSWNKEAVDKASDVTNDYG